MVHAYQDWLLCDHVTVPTTVEDDDDDDEAEAEEGFESLVDEKGEPFLLPIISESR